MRRIFWGILLLMGCQTTRDLPKTDFQLFIEQSKGSFICAHRLTLPISQLQIPVCVQPILLSTDIDHVQRSESSIGTCLIFHLKQRAMIQFYQLAMEGIGRKLVLTINGQPIGVSAPLQFENFDGTLTIFPEVPDERIGTLIDELNETLTKLQALKS